MAKAAGKTDNQRALEKLYTRMCGRYSRYEVWQDMVWMVAITISNAVDKRYFDQRAANYARIAQKYSAEELGVFPEFFNHIVLGMEDNPDCDFLGELYMTLELGNRHTGQFFTPYHLCKAMARMQLTGALIEEEMARQGYISINDCACGAGAMLIAAANHMLDAGFDYQRNALFVGQDIDATTALMCYIQLSLAGCAGYVIIGNTLSEPQVGHVLFGEDSPRCWYTPMYFHDVWTSRRVLSHMKAVFYRHGAARPEADAPEGEPEPAAAEPEARGQPSLTISRKKKNAGQIMFDFGEVTK